MRNGDSGNGEMAKEAMADEREQESKERERGKKEMRKKKKRTRVLTICNFFTNEFFVYKKLMKRFVSLIPYY